MIDKESMRVITRIEETKPVGSVSDDDLVLVRALIGRELRHDVIDAGLVEEDLEVLDFQINDLSRGTGAQIAGKLYDKSAANSLDVVFPGFPRSQIKPVETRDLGRFTSIVDGDRSLVFASGASWKKISQQDTEEAIFLTPTGSLRFRNGELRISVENDTLWLSARWLLPSLIDNYPADAFIALPSKKLTASFAASSNSIVSTPLKGTIEVQLDFQQEMSADREDWSLVPPKTLKLEFDGEGGLFASLSKGQLNLANQQTDLVPTGEILWDNESECLVFISETPNDRIDFGAIPRRFVKLDGAVVLNKSGWVFPVRRISDPENLPRSKPEGGWLCWTEGKISGAWEGVDDVVSIANPKLEFRTSGWLVRGAARGRNAIYQLNGHRLSGGAQPISVSLKEVGPVVFGWGTEAGDFVLFTGDIEPVLSYPVDVSNSPLRLSKTDVSALISFGSDDVKRVAIRQSSESKGPNATYAIENAVFRVQNIALKGIDGVLGPQEDLLSGSIRLQMEAHSWLPTLPDPYISNIPTKLEVQKSSYINAEVTWANELVEVSFAGGFRTEQLKPLEGKGREIVPGNVDRTQTQRQGLTQSGQVYRSDKAEKVFQRQKQKAEKSRGSNISRGGHDVWEKVASEFDDARVRLLDVSSRRDQIGVALKVDARNRVATYKVSGQQTLTDISDIRVFALPQIQWEPVRTLEKDQDLMTLGYFPTPLAHPDDGGATQLESEAVALAPAVPDLLVEAMVDAFDEGDAIRMVTTLPFGIKTLMTLRPQGNARLSPDRVRQVMPAFENLDAVGGLQLAVEAGEWLTPQLFADAGFSGWTFQQPNGVDLDSGIARNTSVLGGTKDPDESVETLFNREFLLSRPKVPLKRLDISGYGASTFSDWRNPYAAFAEASKVEFRVLVGRTALEVVKFASVLYPWGIRVTRSVTVERTAGAGILRRDTGWQPTSSGLFDFSYVPDGAVSPEPSPYEFHPGLVRGLFDVTQIRPADRGRIDLPQGGAVLPMLFDADVELGTDNELIRTQSRGILGYLHLEPVGDPITAADLRSLLDLMGPAGGPLDADLELDTSGMTCRVVRLEVGSAINSGSPVFAAATVGMPKFGASGSWSIAAFPGPNADPQEPPEAVSVDDGTPIIRRGISGAPKNGVIHVPTPDPFIRFADPADLLRPTSPARDFAFLQVCPTHTFAYRRPSIRSGTRTIQAGLPSLFADVMVRTTGSAVFPSEDMAITLPPTTQLVVDSVSRVPRLSAPISIEVTRAPAIISDSGSRSSRVNYSGTSLSLDIQSEEWSVLMPGVEVQNTILGVENFTGMRFDLIGGSNRTDKLDNFKSLLGGPLGQIFDIIPGLNREEPVPPYDLRATNLKKKVKFKVQAKFGSKLPGGDMRLDGAVRYEAGREEISVPSEYLTDAVDKLIVNQDFDGWGVAQQLRGEILLPSGDLLVVGFVLEVGGQSNATFTVPPDGVAVLEPVEIKGKDKDIVEFRIEAGKGYAGVVGPFEARGYVVGIFLFLVQSGGGGLGVGARAELDFSVLTVRVKAYVEMLGLLIQENLKKFIVGSAEIGLNVKVCKFFSVKFSFVGQIKKEF